MTPTKPMSFSLKADSEGRKTARALFAGVHIRFFARVAGRLRTIEAKSSSRPEEILSLVAESDLDLLVLDEGLTDNSISFLEQVRQVNPSLRVIYCGRKGHDSAILARLVHELKVSLILYHPLDPEELVRHVAINLRLTIPELRRKGVGSDADPVLAKVWERCGHTNMKRVESLKEVVTELTGGERARVSDETRANARILSEQFDGLGEKGAARSVARIADLFETELHESEREDLRQEVDALWSELSNAQQARVLVGSEPQASSPRVLVLSPQEKFAKEVLAEAKDKSLEVHAVTSWEGLEKTWGQRSPDAVLVDLSTGTADSDLERLKRIVDEEGPPIVVITSEDSLRRRAELSASGADTVLIRPVLPGVVVETLTEAVRPRDRTISRVLVVNREQSVLDELSRLLQKAGLECLSLTDSLKCWDALESQSPDVLVLDVDLQHLNGIEVCRAVRSDSLWRDLPIILTGSEAEPELMERFFEAGADDFLAKPFEGGCLLAKIRNRMARAKASRALADSDPLTNAATKKRGEELLNRYLRLNHRQGGSMSLALVAVDGYQELLETRGRAAANQVLRSLGKILIKQVRAEDIVVRWGESELLVGLCQMSQEAARSKLDRMLRSLSRLVFQDDAKDVFRSTASGGVTEAPLYGNDVDSLYKGAAAALYRAQELGGSQVALSDSQEWSEATRVDVAALLSDSPLAQDLQACVEERGYSSAWFSDRDKASLQVVGGQATVSPRVLLLDASVESFEVVEFLRSFSRHGGMRKTRVFLLAPELSEEDLLQAFDLGMTDFVPSPVRANLLMRRIDRVMLGASF